MSKILIFAPKRPARMSQKVSAAIEAMVTEGRNITQAAEVAGMSRNGLHKALKRAEVRAYLEEKQKRFIAEFDGKRALAKAMAINVALDLMMNARSESVRARMAEFLAGDGKA